MAAGTAYVGLPEEFSPPDACARRIAALRTRIERETMIARLPPGGWRLWIEHESRIAIALDIADGDFDLEQRRAAMNEVPEAWRPAVAALVQTFWNTRRIRADYRAELAAKRAAWRDRKAPA